ncbi:MAG: hypothetical protein HRT45_19090, partial [Bdellovibrionales bacterium]|nr:hypothetical protein [Bdellovibrionales bacterium]
PNTHALMGSLKTCSEESLTDLVHKGYTHAKFKVGLDSQYEAQKLKSWLGDWPEAVKLRLDFNGSLTEEGFHHWLQSFSAESLLHFDFIEDPFEFSKPSWDKIEGVTLALDRALNEQTVSMWSSGPVIIKPAVQDFRTLELASGQRAIFTNYMDHPVGEMFAIYEACQFYSQLEPEVGGLRAFHFFERHSYAEMIEGSGPELNLPAGTGIGFDELLEQESWLPL